MGKTKQSDIGTKIRYARKDVGMSQRDLAEKLNLSDKAVSTYEVGRAKPSFELLTKISKIVKKPITYFDQTTDISDIDLDMRLERVEQELREIKALLKQRKT